MDHESRETLLLAEVFRSLQGETSHAGLPATFLRLAGCNLDCAWCDTRYARSGGEPRAIDALVAEAKGGPELVVVTGGEPLAQAAVHDLMTRLADAGHRVLLETNGSLDITGVDPRVGRIVDVKCPGSGEAGATRWSNLEDLRAADEVKLVVGDRADFDYAVEVVRRHGLQRRCGVLISPVVERLPPAELAGWILRHGGRLRLQLQLHRVLWPDRERGV